MSQRVYPAVHRHKVLANAYEIAREKVEELAEYVLRELRFSQAYRHRDARRFADEMDSVITAASEYFNAAVGLSVKQHMLGYSEYDRMLLKEAVEIIAIEGTLPEVIEYIVYRFKCSRRQAAEILDRTFKQDGLRAPKIKAHLAIMLQTFSSLEKGL